jgi:hypothetical protein
MPSAHLTHGGLGPVVVVRNVKMPNLFALRVEFQDSVLAVVGDHRVSVGQALRRFCNFHPRLAQAPDHFLVRGHFLHFAGNDQNISVLEQLHIMAIVVRECLQPRAILFDLDHGLVVVVGAIDVGLSANST